MPRYEALASRDSEDAEGKGSENQPSFSRTVLCWLVGGYLGLHRWYLGDRIGARSFFFSCGHCLVGWLSDGWHLRALVERARTLRANRSARLVHVLSRTTAAAFCRNQVSNTKYGSSSGEMLLKFLPMSILEQLERNTNRYFLLIAILQLDASLTPTNPLTTWLPLFIIFFVTAARELADDR